LTGCIDQVDKKCKNRLDNNSGIEILFDAITIFSAVLTKTLIGQVAQKIVLQKWN